MNSNETLLTSRQVRTRYGGVSDQTIWRWLHDEKVGFPQPTVISKRRYWKLSELEGWERLRATTRMEAA